MANDQNDSQSTPSRLPTNDSVSVPAVGHLSDSEASTMAISPGSLDGHLEEFLAQGGSSAKSDQNGSIESALEFRVVRPGLPIRRLRLTGNRYTFGSGEGCSIRLDDETLRPMHAVLLRDAHRVLMRAYSVPLECNGNRITESTLRVGDIIRMGSYRFELLAAPNTISLPASTATGTGVGAASGFSKLSASQDSLEVPLKNRLTELSQQWHARHAECEVRESRCDQRESELHGRETELWSRAKDLQQRESLLIAQEAAVREIQETYTATQAELKAVRQREVQASESLQAKEAELVQKSEQLLERQAELEKRQAEWQTREEQYAERAADAQRTIEQTQRQAQSASDAVGRMREEFATLNEQLTELRERHSQLQQRERQEQSEHERLRKELEAARNDAIDAQAESEAARSAAEDELRRVTAELESTRQEIISLRDESQACQQELNEKLRATGEQLQEARQQAEQSRRAAEEEQAYTEKRVAELEERLAEVQENRSLSEAETTEKIDKLRRKYHAEEERRRAAEKNGELAEQERLQAEEARKGAEQVAEQLQANIHELQQSVDQANQDATQLQTDYEGAKASIRQLELLVDQTKNNQSAQQDSWSEESDQLRATIEELSVQLANANAELSQLKEANEALKSELHGDSSAVGEDSGSLVAEQYQILERELDAAREEIDRLKQVHDDTVARLESERRDSESALHDEIEQLREEIVQTQRSAEARVSAILAGDGGTTENASNQQLAFAGSLQTPDSESENSMDLSQFESTDHEPTQDSIAQEDDQQTRMLTDQDDEFESSLWLSDPAGIADADANAEHGETLTDAEPNQWSALGDDGEHGNEVEQVGDAQHDSERSSVSWHDEPPESAMQDAIDDIEHNVEQAMGPSDESAWEIPAGAAVNEAENHVEQSDDSAAPLTNSDMIRQFANGDSSDSDTPLHWDAYMPGGDVEQPELEDSQSRDLSDADQADPELGEENDTTQRWRETPNDALEEVDGSQPSNPDEHADADPIGKSGSLAAMLIHDLDQEAEEDAAQQSVDDANDSPHVENDSPHDEFEQSEFPPIAAESEEVLLLEEPSVSDADEDLDQDQRWDLASPPVYDESAIDFSESEGPILDGESGSPMDLPIDDPSTVEASADSIEAYMNRLLQRVQPEDGVSKVTSADAEEPREANGEEQSSHEPEVIVADEAEMEHSFVDSISDESVDVSLSDSTPLIPRSHAPERNRDVSAMRDLANQSARNAVARSIRVQARDTQMNAFGKAAFAACFIVMAIGVYYFLSWWSTTIKFSLVGALLVLAGVFAQEAYILARDARRRLALAESNSGDMIDDPEIADELQRMVEEADIEE